MDAFVPATVVCNGIVSAACDAPDHCTGSTPSCPAELAPAGTSCRASVGACDPEETCDGVSTTCPPDGFMCADAGVMFDAGTDADAPDATVIVDAEVGDAMIIVDAGSDATVEMHADAGEGEASVTMDAGADADADTDAEAGRADGSGVDAMTLDSGRANADAGPPAAVAGCACRMSGRRTGLPASFLLLIAVAAMTRRARRAAAR
jgi:hypothetical protein